MFWSDAKIQQWLEAGGVIPADKNCVNPASLDLRLGAWYRIPQPDGWSALRAIPDAGLILAPNAFVLLATLEVTRIPDNAAAFLYLKSSAGRKGLEHLHAGYGDPGFCGQWTLEVINHWPFPRTIFEGERLFQICLADCSPVMRPYGETGHYQFQLNPTAAWQGGAAPHTCEANS